MVDGEAKTATARGIRHKPRAHFEKRATAAMEKHLPKSRWPLRQKLALTARMLAAQEHATGLAGQITARGEAPDTMWTARFGLGFQEVRARDFLMVDDGLNVLRGEGMPNPSNRFHLWIYRARPDVHCVVHTHPPHCSALSMIGVPLRAAHMDTAILHDDCAWLETWPGPPIGDEEGELISGALGDKNSILLAHHGQLAAAPTVEETAVRALTIEYAARLQLLAMAAGSVRALPSEAGRQAHDYRLKPALINATFHYHARLALEDAPECLEEDD